MKKFWSFAQGPEATDLYILTEIAAEESWWSDVMTPQRFRDELFRMSGEIHVWLDSPGGDAFAGAAMYDMLREYSASGRGRTVAMVSLAASAASLIAMACDEIRISMVGTMMIHEPWSLTAGNAGELRATADVLDQVRQAQVNAYAKRTGKSTEEIEALMKGPDGSGTWMNAAAAMELGFADRLMYDDDGEADGDDLARRIANAKVASCVLRARENVRVAAMAKAQAEPTPMEPTTEPKPDPALDNVRAELLRTIARSW